MSNPEIQHHIFGSVLISEYFCNTMMERKYISSIEEIKKTILVVELISIAKQHFSHLNSINQYYRFFRVWRPFLGCENMQILGQEVKQTLLKKISEEVYVSKENPYGVLKLINLILNLLNIQDELQQEKVFLSEGFESFARAYKCNYCQDIGMHIHEDTLICPKCGFAREF